MQSQQPLYFEDFAPGQVYRTAAVRVDADAIKRFAREFDPQPLHLDEQAAAKGFFGGLTSSGWHTAALTMQLIVLKGVPVAGGTIGAGVDELRWPQPVRPGDSLHLQMEILEMRPSRSRPTIGLVKMRTTTLNQNDEPVQIMVANLVVPRRGAG